MKFQQSRFYDRELSWLSFNHRVLQEAEEAENPLMERIKFLAIHSSNMDEFYRVRVASLRSLDILEKGTRKELLFNPKQILRKIHAEVYHQQFLFGEIFRNEIVPELRKLKIFLTRSEELTQAQIEDVQKYFKENVEQFIEPQFFEKGYVPDLKDGRLYLAIRMRSAHIDADGEEIYAVVPTPSHKVSRFYVMQDGENKYVLFLGDIVRIGLKYVFPTFEILGSYQIKMSRDSDLHIEDEFSGDLVKKIKEGLVKRTKGVPMRFLYDIRMPEEMLLYFKKQYRLTNLDLVPGGRYHSLNDFFSFPNKEKTIPEFSTIAPIPHPDLVQQPSILSVAHKKDVLLHYPYQPFDYVIQLIDEAARHPEVTDISITLYRVASDSKVIQALLTAAENGKVVTAFVELKARFNEADNLSWAEKMEKAGIKVLYSLPAVKVHAKLCLISFKKEKRICYFSTGNLNEKTAALYCDMGLITSDTRLTDDAFLVFHTLINKLHVFEDQGSIPHFQHLLVAPKYLRNGLYECIDNEIAHAKAGKQAHIIAKMNSLDDWEMIEKLYEASCAGVKIGLIIRGICCLIPGVAQQSENIQIRSIIGRYLEHARIAYFLNGGKEKIFLSSADWMRRNLDRRIEVAFPIYDGEIQHEIKEYLALQLRDNINTRIINKKQDNSYSRPRRTEKLVDAHLDMYTLLETIYHKRLTNTPKESGNKKGKEK